MKLRPIGTVLLLGLWGVAVSAGPFDEAPPGAESVDSDVLNMLDALSQDLLEASSRPDVWLKRYQVLANQTAANSAVTTELLGISRVAMPIIWNAYTGDMSLRRAEKLSKEGVHVFQPSDGSQPISHPLLVLPTSLTDQQDFIVEVLLLVTEEANVGLRIMYEPWAWEQEFSFDHGDVMATVHIRWHFDYGNSREVAMNDKYNGEWSPLESVVSGDQWSNLTVGEKFMIKLVKKGNCFHNYIFTGADMYLQTPKILKPQTFCPQPRRQTRMLHGPRGLRVTVNEDIPGADQVKIYGVFWYPIN